MSVSQLIEEAYTGLKSLVIGLGVTGKAFLQPGVTVIYPMEEVARDALVTYRGHVELIGKEDDPAVPRCVACGACVKACPSSCITILCPVAPKEGEEGGPAKMAPPPQKGCKTPGAFIVDFSLCSLCGQCAKTCPVDSLQFSDNPYMVSFDRKDFQIDLLARLKRTAGEEAEAG